MDKRIIDSLRESVLATTPPQPRAGDTTLGGIVPPRPQELMEQSTFTQSQLENATPRSACSSQSPQSVESTTIVLPHGGDATPGSVNSTQLAQSEEMSVIIPSLPYQVSHVAPNVSTEQSDATNCIVSEPGSISNLMVKMSCRKDKKQKEFCFARGRLQRHRHTERFEILLSTQVAHTFSGERGIHCEGKEESMVSHR